MPDAHKNFAISSVAAAPSPATSGLNLTVATGEGALFPTPPFNATVWPSAARGLATNAEIVRVTGIAGDVFTIVRAQENTSARSILVGDQIAATITAKTLTDAENNAWDTVIKKSIDESVSASVTLQNDDELFFATASGGVYEFEFYLIYASPVGGGTPDFKFVTGEDATTRGVMALPSGYISTTDTIGSPTSAFCNQTATFAIGTAATNRVARVHGWYVGNGGTFRLLWAQNTSNANPTIVRAGSLLRYRRII
jgi:hypothetical protein